MQNKKTVVVTGATGTVGKALCKHLLEKDYPLIVFSRTPEQARAIVPGAAQYLPWKPTEEASFADVLDDTYGVIHLASAPAFGTRWTPAYKRTLYESCVLGTRGLVRALAATVHPPQVFVSASSIGYYGYSEPGSSTVTRIDEHTLPGKDFIARLNVDWEQEAAQAEAVGIRTVMLRTGFLLDSVGGGLPYLINMTKGFRGGSTLPGTQYQSWIHIDDEVGAIMMALENARLRGPVNAVAPQPTTNAQLMAALRSVMGRAFGMPFPGRLLQLFMGESADILTKGRAILPGKLLELSYQFKFSTIESALQDLVEKYLETPAYVHKESDA
nr:TIGR01777 family oxidoreductase [Ktedonobacteraceae bacterium]